MSVNTFHPSDRIFVVGNGNNFSERTDALTIYKSGLISISNSLGIGTESPTANLSVNGKANKLGSGTWAVLSGLSIKNNISNHKEGLALIMQVRPVNFSYSEKAKEIFGKNVLLENEVYQGVIAQELQNIAPDMVREVIVESEEFLEIDPNKFTYALINAVQQQQELIAKQNNLIQAIETQLKNQQKEIETIKKILKR